MSLSDISDFAWRLIEPVLPRKSRGFRVVMISAWYPGVPLSLKMACIGGMHPLNMAVTSPCTTGSNAGAGWVFSILYSLTWPYQGRHPIH